MSLRWKTARIVVLFVAVVAAIGIILGALASTSDWKGNGSEHLPCTNGAHWVLAPAQGITSATLTVNGVQYPMQQSGQGSFSADSQGPLDENLVASVEYEGENEKAHLQLSHCLDKATPSPSVSPHPSKTPKPDESPSPSVSPTHTKTHEPSPSVSPTKTKTPKPEKSPSPSASPHKSPSPSPSVTKTPSPEHSPSPSASPSASPHGSPSASPSASPSVNPSSSPSASVSPSASSSPSQPVQPSPSASPSPTTGTATPTVTVTPTQPTATASPTPTGTTPVGKTPGLPPQQPKPPDTGTGIQNNSSDDPRVTYGTLLGAVLLLAGGAFAIRTWRRYS